MVYLDRVQGLNNLLRGKTVSDLIVLFATFATDPSPYGEPVEYSHRDNMMVINADLAQLKDLGDAINAR